MEINEKYLELLKRECLSFSVLNTHKAKGVVYYEKDTNITAAYVDYDSKKKAKIEYIKKGNRVLPIEFVITGNGQTEEDRIHDLARKDNILFIKFLMKMATLENNAVVVPHELKNHDVTWKDSEYIFENVQQSVENHRYYLDKFLVSEYFLDNIKETQHPIHLCNKTGDFICSERPLPCHDSYKYCIGSLWGNKIFKIGAPILPLIPPVVFGVGEDKFVGHRSIRNLEEIEDSNNKTVLILLGSMTILNPQTICIGTTRKFLINKLNVKKIFAEIKKANRIK